MLAARRTNNGEQVLIKAALRCSTACLHRRGAGVRAIRVRRHGAQRLHPPKKRARSRLGTPTPRTATPNCWRYGGFLSSQRDGPGIQVLCIPRPIRVAASGGIEDPLTAPQHKRFDGQRTGTGGQEVHSLHRRKRQRPTPRVLSHRLVAFHEFVPPALLSPEAAG